MKKILFIIMIFVTSLVNAQTVTANNVFLKGKKNIKVLGVNEKGKIFDNSTVIDTLNFEEKDPFFKSWDKDYEDLINKPNLFSGDWDDIKNMPSGFKDGIDNDTHLTPQELDSIMGNKYIGTKAVFSFVFDGVNSSDQTAFDICQTYNIVPDFSIKGNKMTDLNMQLYKRFVPKGSSILSNSMNYPSMSESHSLSDDEWVYEVSEIKKRLRLFGFNPYGWATPRSIMRDTDIDKLRKYYKYAFTKGLEKNYIEKKDDLFRLSRYGIEATMLNGGMVKLKKDIDEAIEKGHMVVFFVNNFPSNYLINGSSCFNREHLIELLSYIRNKVKDNLCETYPVNEAVKYYFNASVEPSPMGSDGGIIGGSLIMDNNSTDLLKVSSSRINHIDGNKYEIYLHPANDHGRIYFKNVTTGEQEGVIQFNSEVFQYNPKNALHKWYDIPTAINQKPDSCTAPCRRGQEWYDDTSYYKCVSPNQWRRAVISKF